MDIALGDGFSNQIKLSHEQANRVTEILSKECKASIV